ncbi:MAG: SUMF1/EgtB/PvdO family nonheme iron enzyme [Polyangiaceae bacterium]
MRVLVVGLLAFAFTLAAAVGCSGDESNGGDANCEPGATRTCVGPGACEGGQRCSPDGRLWGVCECAASTGGSGGVPVDGSAGGSGGTGGASGVGGSLDSGTGGDPSKCPQGRGPAMVDMGSYCIDSTEVSRLQFQEFLDDQKNAATPQFGGCKSNSFDNVANCPGAPATTPHLPAGCADWCDAWAFCSWAGKRLCGKLGGGPLTKDEITQPQVSEWAHACTQGGSSLYPWGDSPANNCNFGPCSGGYCTHLVGSHPQCTGTAPPFDGVFDLLGNVYEFVESCDLNPATLGCYAVGSSYYDGQKACSEGVWKATALAQGYDDFGIRCCADRAP